MRLIEGERKISAIADGAIALGSPCTYTPATNSVAILSGDPIAGAIVCMVDRVEDRDGYAVPGAIADGDKVIFAFRGLYEVNDATLAAAVVAGDLVEFTETGFQKESTGLRAGYVAGVSGSTVLIQFNGITAIDAVE